MPEMPSNHISSDATRSKNGENQRERKGDLAHAVTGHFLPYKVLGEFFSPAL